MTGEIKINLPVSHETVTLNNNVLNKLIYQTAICDITLLLQYFILGYFDMNIILAEG